MTWQEAFSYIRAGGKVKRSCWDATFLFFKDDTVYSRVELETPITYTWPGHHTETSAIDWEIVN